MAGNEHRTLEASYASYYARMRLILRWRRIAWLSCGFIVLLTVVIFARDPQMDQPSDRLLVTSLIIFMVALMLAVNFLTVRFRASRPRGLDQPGHQA